MDYDGLLDRLTERGIIIHNRDDALRSLRTIGYYRLLGYLYPFRVLSRRYRRAAYLENTRFDLVLKVYALDRQLRLLILEAIEQIEISVRAQVVHVLTQVAPSGDRRDSATYQNAFHGKPRKDWQNKCDTQFQKSPLEVARHHLDHYQPPYALWAVAETWDFGTLSTLVSGLHPDTLRPIASFFGLPNPVTFARLLEGLRPLRNFSAHHSRVWNNTFAKHNEPTIRALDKLARFRPIAAAHRIPQAGPQSKVYLFLLVLAAFTTIIDPSASWTDRLTEHLRERERLAWGPFHLAAMGAPSSWETDIWLIQNQETSLA